MGRAMNELHWHIEWRDPNELIPYDGNAKLHDGRNIQNIANSIDKYGWQSYLVVTKAGIVVIGHGRRLAAIELGCKCPCKVVEEDLTEAEIRELRDADNLTQDGKYDWDKLSEDLNAMELDFSGFDFDLKNIDDVGESSYKNGGEPDVDDEGYKEFQEPLSQDELSEYENNADEFLMKRRVIITYTPEKEEFVKKMLGIEDEKIKVVYDIDDLIGVDDE